MDKLRDNEDWVPESEPGAIVPTPDTGISGSAESSYVPQEPDQAEATDDPQAAPPPVHQATEKPKPADTDTFEGKLVFSPHELNQSGEDKEYFHPDKDHKFDAPKDANKHALTPDIEVTPDNTVKKIG